MSEMWERTRVIYEIVLEAVGGNFPEDAVGRALAWADQLSKPDIEIELLLGGLGAVAANILTDCVGADQARENLQRRMTANDIQEIFDDLGPIDPTETGA